MILRSFFRNNFKRVYRTSSMRAQCYSNIKVLGIETSCDDTGCAVVNAKGELLGDALYSQGLIHLKYGGINPTVAHDLHRDNIEAVVKEALLKSSLEINNIDAIAVTVKPGLLISLQIGVKYAKYLARNYDKPIIPIHHMEAHALVARMYHAIQFPFLTLLISGGHCLLAVAKDVNNFLLLGQCLDNPPGEAFDKAARRMKLRNIPLLSKLSGGQAIEAAATKATNYNQFKFPLPLMRDRDCNFSFSGLKETLLRHLLSKETEHGVVADEVIPEVYDLCASFQIAVAEHIVHRTNRAMLYCKKSNLIPQENQSLVVSGGVACNDLIFNSLKFLGTKTEYNVFRPPPKVCTDNGIMIAWNGIEKIRKGCELSTSFDVRDIEPKAPFGRNITKEVREKSIKVTRLKLNY